MIREVRSHLEGEKSNSISIRRTFIPIELEINRKGQYQTFKKKIPYNVKRVVGVIMTHDAPDHLMLGNRIFLGSSSDVHITSAFICKLNSDLVHEDRQCHEVKVKTNEKLYYAQPKRLGYALLTINGQYGKFKSPVTLLVRDVWTDIKEEYLVWESKYKSLGKVELCVIPDTDDDDDDHDDDD